MSGRGRPSKFTQDACERFLAATRAGAWPEVAAGYAGWSAASWYRYKTGTTAEHEAFREAYAQALTGLEISLSGVVVQAARTDPRQAVIMLERRFPERWRLGARVDRSSLAAMDRPVADADAPVILDPTLIGEIVPRLLAAGREARAVGPTADDVPIERFEQQRPADDHGAD